MENEIWKEICGFEGLYSASNLGRIRKEPCKIYYGDHRGYREEPQKIKKQTLRPTGYYFVTISKERKRFGLSVHRLIAWAFLGKQENGIEVRHIDGNKKNNNINNLCYGTKSDNMRDSIKHRTFSMSEWHPCAKLTNEQVKEIKESNEYYKDIGKRFDIHPHTVHKLRRNLRRNHD